MILKQLLEQKQNIDGDIQKCLEGEFLEIKLAADTMAECATNIKGQGYSAFINSRENFLEKIDRICRFYRNHE